MKQKHTAIILCTGRYKLIALLLSLLTISLSCKKIIEIPAPNNTISTSQVFATDVDAEAAVNGIYSKLAGKSTNASFGNGWFTYFLALASDEFEPVNADQAALQFYRNEYTSQNAITSTVWIQAYSLLYQINSCIQNIETSEGITITTRKRLLAEVIVLRAFVYYYLTSIFGDVPFVLTTEWKTNMAMKRESETTVRARLIDEINIVLNDLPTDFTKFKGERIRVTRAAALTLLGKFYIDRKDYSKAVEAFTEVVNDRGNFQIVDSLNEVFLKNSSETIWQLHNYDKVYPFNALPEATMLIPYSSDSEPFVRISDDLLNSFTANDKRREKWISYTTYNGSQYYYPSKYKVGAAQADPSLEVTEYYMVFRLADVILLRSEAYVKSGLLEEAAADVNLIRKRAGLDPITVSSSEALKHSVMEERRKELFWEWGNRWFDIMRSDNVDILMTNIVKKKDGSGWETFRKLFPIFISEIESNPLCSQNPGY